MEATASSGSNAAETNQLSAQLGHVLPPANETAEERMIRLGEMTPFGTVMKNQGSCSKDCVVLK